jgi:transposase
MGKSIVLRQATTEEERQLEKWSRSGKTEQRLARRARIILLKLVGTPTTSVAERVTCDPDTVACWVKRFNEQGINGLKDKAGRGRKRDYSEMQRGEMVITAKTSPEQLGLPFGYWSLRRLVDYLHQQKGLAVSRAQLARILEAEGLRWYQEQTYFTERPDPQFVEKRGRL